MYRPGGRDVAAGGSGEHVLAAEDRLARAVDDRRHRVRRSHGCLPVSVPRNITPVLAVSAMSPRPGRCRVVGAAGQRPGPADAGLPTQREKPTLTTYDRLPWPGWTVKSSGQVRTPIAFVQMARLLGEAESDEVER